MKQPQHQPFHSTISEQNAVNLAVRDWLETQANVAAYWRDILVERNGDLELIEALDRHSDFLRAQG